MHAEKTRETRYAKRDCTRSRLPRIQALNSPRLPMARHRPISTARPGNSKGGAAIYRDLTSAIASYQAMAAKPIPQAKNTAVGFKFRTGPRPIYVYCAGAIFTSRSKGVGTLPSCAKRQNHCAPG